MNLSVSKNMIESNQFENMICFHNINNNNNMSQNTSKFNGKKWWVCFSVTLKNMRLQKPTDSTCFDLAGKPALLLHSAFKKRRQSKDDEINTWSRWASEVAFTKVAENQTNEIFFQCYFGAFCGIWLLLLLCFKISLEKKSSVCI